MDDRALFEKEKNSRIASNASNQQLQNSAAGFNTYASEAKYSYNFTWLGLPIIQMPQDILAMQEIIWRVKPDLIIETGVARGGSLIFYASMLELIGSGEVLGIDIDIRPHNYGAIANHPFAKRIRLIEGSSIDGRTLDKVKACASAKKRIVVCLDSNHTHSHVLQELEMYAPLTTVGSYCVVFDTIVEDMPAEMFSDRPWGPGDNPKTAVREYLKTHTEFEKDLSFDHKLLISVAPEGYLLRVK